MRLGRRISLVLALYITCVGPTLSATLKVVPANSGHVVVQLSGRIDFGDADAFLSLVKGAEASGKVVDSVELNSAGGRLVGGARLAAAIKTSRIPTSVREGAVCASACFLAFAAGESKFAAEGALIGVHKASESGGRETLQSKTATTAMARFAKDLGVPTAITARMVSTPATQIEWLSYQDLKSMRVAVGGKPLQRSQLVSVADSSGPNGSGAAAESVSQHAAPRTTASWNEYIEKVMVVSANQNDGRAAVSRSCKSDSQECAVSIAFLLKDGRQAIATVTQDASGKTTKREVCENDPAHDLRDCMDWDSGTKYRISKNSRGEWSQIAE
jgi:hypothetical protein